MQRFKHSPDHSYCKTASVQGGLPGVKLPPSPHYSQLLGDAEKRRCTDWINVFFKSEPALDNLLAFSSMNAGGADP